MKYGKTRPYGDRMFWLKLAWMSVVLATVIVPPATALPAVYPVVETEELVYQFEPANNGSHPMWCRGSTTIVRAGEHLFASGMETLADVPPLNNCRWLLFQRKPGGWEQVAVDERGRTREPSPLAIYNDGRLFLSANPTLVTDRQAEGGGPAKPELLVFDVDAPEAGYERLTPLEFRRQCRSNIPCPLIIPPRPGQVPNPRNTLRSWGSATSQPWGMLASP